MKKLGFKITLLFTKSVRELEDNVMTSEKGAYLKIFNYCSIFTSDTKHPILDKEYPFQVHPKSMISSALNLESQTIQTFLNTALNDVST